MQVDITKAIELMLDVYLLKIIAAGIIFICASTAKDIVLAWLTRRNLIRMEAIHIDKYVKIGEVEGTVDRIGITHLRLETKTGVAYIPNEYLLKRALIQCPKMKRSRDGG